MRGDLAGAFSPDLQATEHWEVGSTEARGTAECAGAAAVACSDAGMTVLLVVALLLLGAAGLQPSRVVGAIAAGWVGLTLRLLLLSIRVAVVALMLRLFSGRVATELRLKVQAREVAVKEVEHMALELVLGVLQ